MVKQTKNGLHDIPGYDGMEDEAFPPLPPPHSPGLGREDEGDPFATGEEEGDVSKLEEVPAAKRKGVKRPQPKLDSNRLTSERGLPALRTLFDSVHFKGKGHEAENLRLLMQKMENWAHRLFPKLQFEDFIDKVEKLGNKKEVQTCLKRIRLDMPLTHEDFMGEEEEAAPDSNIFGEPDPFSRGSFTDEPIHSTPAPAAPPTPAATPSSPAAAAPSLTEEQRKRMELNRQRALERRLARQQQKTEPSDSQPADASLLADEPSSVSSANVLDNSKDQQQEQEQEEEKEEKEVVEEEEKEKEKDLDLQPVSSSTQQPDQLSPKDSEPSEPPTPCETAESSNGPVNQPTNSCEEED